MRICALGQPSFTRFHQHDATMYASPDDPAYSGIRAAEVIKYDGPRVHMQSVCANTLSEILATITICVCRVPDETRWQRGDASDTCTSSTNPMFAPSHTPNAYSMSATPPPPPRAVYQLKPFFFFFFLYRALSVTSGLRSGCCV